MIIILTLFKFLCLENYIILTFIIIIIHRIKKDNQVTV
jgi:hypothetical protein